MINQKRTSLIRLAALATLPWTGWSGAGLAQEKPLRVGLIAFSNSEMSGHLRQALVDALRERGFVEGRNLQLLRGYADGRPERLPDIAARLDAVASPPYASLMVLPDDPFLTHLRRRLVAVAARHRIPSFFGINEAVEDGGLMSYGQPLYDAHHRAAYYVDRIAKGAKPADLPVEQPTRFQLTVNQKTARTLGLALPHALLLRADRVIE